MHIHTYTLVIYRTCVCVCVCLYKIQQYSTLKYSFGIVVVICMNGCCCSASAVAIPFIYAKTPFSPSGYSPNHHIVYQNLASSFLLLPYTHTYTYNIYKQTHIHRSTGFANTQFASLFLGT